MVQESLKRHRGRISPAAAELGMPEKLTVNELFALFGRTPDETRWVGFADSEEYLALVTYVVERSYRRY